MWVCAASAHSTPRRCCLGPGRGRVLGALQAPRDPVALAAAMTVGLGTSLVITLTWKISMHVAVAAGAMVILVLVHGPPGSC